MEVENLSIANEGGEAIVAIQYRKVAFGQNMAYLRSNSTWELVFVIS
jgi:hypothetical protein